MKKVISQKEIDQCINLLHSDYHGCPVYVFHSFRDYLKWSFKERLFDLPQLKKAWKGKTAGSYDVVENFIQIYIFNHESSDRYIKQSVIHTLYHELRHYYQFTYKSKKWNSKNVVSYKWGDPKYSESDIEKDADKFAGRMLERNKEKISEILNVYTDWETVRYRPGNTTNNALQDDLTYENFLKQIYPTVQGNVQMLIESALKNIGGLEKDSNCLLYTSPSPRD